MKLLKISNSKSQVPNKIQIQNSNSQTVWELVIGNWKFQSGFTLVELLVSITIIVMLLGLTLAGYGRFSQRQTVLSAGQTMKNILRDAQSRAYTGEEDCTMGCDCGSGGSPLVGWFTDFTSNSIYGQCGSTVFGNKPFALSPDIVIAPYLTPAPPAPQRIQFRPYPPGTEQSGTICLSDTKLPENYYSIRIGYSGEISDQANLLTCCPVPIEGCP